MRGILKLFLVIVISIFAFACEKDDKGGGVSFKEQTISGVYTSNGTIFQFNDDLHQRSVNRSKLNVRLQNDVQDEFLSCTMSSMPRKVGESLSLTLISKGVSIQEGVYNVTVQALSNGKYWLWSSTKNIGFVVDFN